MDLVTVPNAAEKRFCFLHVIDEAVFGGTFRRLEKQAPEDDKKGHNLIAS